MNIKDKLCAGFCAGLDVRPVKSGLVIGTPFERGDGDRIGFYLAQRADGEWRLEDDGMTAASLIASGVDLRHGERAAEFARMLTSADAAYDPETLLITSKWLTDGEVAHAALRFVGLLMRVYELQMLHPDKVENTFKEDVKAAISQHFGKTTSVVWNCPVSDTMTDFIADAIISHHGKNAAIFIANADTRIYEAVMARALSKAAQRDGHIKFIAVLESERSKSISLKAQQRARNYLDAAPSFAGDISGAMSRIADILNFTPTEARLH